jgi:hypothetical protein
VAEGRARASPGGHQRPRRAARVPGAEPLWDLDDDGYPEPYCVTVHKETRKVVRIKARFDADGVTTNAQGEVVRIEPLKYVTKYGFMPSVDGSYYDVGFGLLLEAINETVNSTINQLMDAGHLANTQGGFIGAGVSIKSGALKFAPGEWKKVEATGVDLKNSIVPLPIKEPSAVLFNLLGMLIEAAKEISATKDILTGETNQAQQPVGTTLAMIEQGLKVYTAIIKRVHRALKAELGLSLRPEPALPEPGGVLQLPGSGRRRRPGGFRRQRHRRGPDLGSDDGDGHAAAGPGAVHACHLPGRSERGSGGVGPGWAKRPVSRIWTS